MMKFSIVVLALLGACTDAATALQPTAPDAPDVDPGTSDHAVDLSGSPVGAWTWHDIPGSECGYGQQTGIGVSIGTSSDVLIYLEGGGLCWDEASCELDIPALAPITKQPVLASYFTSGFTGAKFDAIASGGGYSAGVFDRTLPNNPYKDATQIYVPYCTGDLHTGDAQQLFRLSKQVAHWDGRGNVERAVAAVVASFPSTTHVTLSGSSAGGFGALFDFPLVKEAFADDVRVDLVSDSGPVFDFPSPFLQSGYARWNTSAEIPSECAACVGHFTDLYAYYAAKYPTSRFAIVSHDEDLVISAGYLLPPYPGFYFAMKDFTQRVIAPHANWRYFVSGGLAHTSLYDLKETSVRSKLGCALSVLGRCVVPDPLHPVETGRTQLADWLGAMAADSPDWVNTTSINQ